MRVLMGLIKNEHGVYCARKKVPAQLQEAVAALLGGNKHKQTWLQKSLGTKELREANVRAKPVLMEFDAILARAGDTLKQQPLRASWHQRKSRAWPSTTTLGPLRTMTTGYSTDVHGG